LLAAVAAVLIQDHSNHLVVKVAAVTVEIHQQMQLLALQHQAAVAAVQVKLDQVVQVEQALSLCVTQRFRWTDVTLCRN
jgi:hypothetical protein